MNLKEYRVIHNTEKHPELDVAHEYIYDGDTTSNEDVVKMLNHLFKMNRLAEEYIYVVAMNFPGRILGIFQLSHGDFKSSYAQNRELFIFLLLVGAERFMVAHNHPNGQLYKSENDVQATKKFQDMAKIIGINMDEHFIIGSEGYSQLVNQLPENKIRLKDFMDDSATRDYMIPDDMFEKIQLQICQIEGIFERDKWDFYYESEFSGMRLALNEEEFETLIKDLEGYEQEAITCKEDLSIK